MTIHYTVDTSAIDREMKRLENLPNHGDVIALESTLANQFAATQMVVHIETGSLKASGKIDSNRIGPVWRGEISYGGVSVGSVYDPVDYAEYELDRRGSHDFLAPAAESDHLYDIVIAAIIKGVYK